MTKKSNSALNLTGSEWDLMSDLCEVLIAFPEVTTYMCTESAVSVSEVLYKPASNSTAGSVSALESLLNPRYKKVQVGNDHERRNHSKTEVCKTKLTISYLYLNIPQAECAAIFQ